MSVLGPDSPLFKKEPSRRGQWLVHHPYTVPLAILVIAPTQEVIYGINSAGQWIAFALSQIFVFLIFFETWSSLKHMRGFCEFCFHQPAGGPEVAQKHMRHLRAHHRKVNLASKRWRWIVFVLAVYAPIIFLTHWAYVAYVIAFFFLFGFLDKTSQTHAWLVPWCPWCKDDGRWTEPSPTPDPSMTKVNS